MSHPSTSLAAGAAPLASHRRRWYPLLLLALALPVAKGSAQTSAEAPIHRATGATPIDVETYPRPSTHATRTQGRITVDGRLDEAGWAEAAPITEFIQSQPRQGSPATERTVARILYDDEGIYFGVMAYDTEPHRLTITSLERDFPAVDNDAISVAIDPNLDRRNGYIITVNPAGAISDMQSFDDQRNTNYAWDGVINVRTAVTDSGWTMEMAIPWSTLRSRGSPGEQAWGFNILRRVRRINEVSYWSPLDQREFIPKLSRAGTLTGLTGVPTPRNLTVKPYLVGSQLGGSSLSTGDRRAFDGGMDLKYGITPRLTLDATYRTDFSHVEVDQEQVNLDRFPLFFPERREFFIENSGIFLFGDAAHREYRSGASLSDFTLFHTRRIGLTSTGQRVPMLGGVRVSGRAAGFEMGMLNMQTEETLDRPAENFGVLRLRRGVFSNSDVGMLFANRQMVGADGDYNRSLGFDANFRFFDRLMVTSYLAGVSAPGLDGDRSAARVSVGWRDRMWNSSVLVRRFGEDFQPGMGFVRRRGMYHYYGTVGAHPRPASLPRIQEINPYLEISYITDLEALLETRQANAGLGISMKNGGNISVRTGQQYEHLSNPFRVTTAAVIPAGEYDFLSTTLSYSSNRGRALSGTANVVHGGYFSGSRTSFGLGTLWRASPRLALELSGNRNEISLPTGDFTADIASAAVRYALSTTLLSNVLVQYNGATDQMITNARLRFVHAPLSDLFLVYTDRRDVQTGAVLERGLTLKLTRLFGF